MAKWHRISPEEAAKMLLELASPPTLGETVALPEGAGRIVAEDIAAGMDQPPFHRSPLDGYAMSHLDLKGAGPDTPAVLLVSSHVYAGDDGKAPVTRGHAARIMTGAPIPPGADCVVRQEDTDCGEEQVRIFVSPGEHDNIVFRGEDVTAGQLLAARGSLLDSAMIGVLASQGKSSVRVYPKPVVGVLSTGSELTPPGEPLLPGHIYDGNGYYLASRLEQLGMRPLRGGIVADNPEMIAAALREMLPRCDVIVTTGGVSVGAKDCMPAAAQLLEATTLFHGLSVKPGTPAMALHVAGKPVVCLSGNPFAAAATFELVATPLLRRLAGNSQINPPRVTGILRDSFPKASKGRRVIRARMAGGDIFLPRGHSSGMLASLSGCNCLLDIPAGTGPLEPGMKLEALLL